ncbi:patatin-like phospholipase family protein [Macromonas nakdongensis]|uniref:patatin-like phospholipase family protein n=1 Tax=Macromonas nakdongensis TaxID=1843082 RepID=UPI000C33A71F|nr:patatin-like phospholipase family protein [Macromonas nakdongensis]
MLAALRLHLLAFCCLGVGLWSALGPAQAQTTTADTPDRPRVGLVLSGGGARGFAHVGLLQALEEARVPVDLVVGTSMGAIIGGLYASGLAPDALEREILGVDWTTLFTQRLPRQELSQRRKEEDFEFSPVLQLGFQDGEFRLPQGAVSSRSLELLLRRLTLHTRQLGGFDGLPIPFRAVATDMENGQPVLLASGDLAAALRASMSVPGVFSPLHWQGRILGDGGLVNNLPVDVARRLGADVVIAVNIGTPLAARDTLDTAVGVTLQMINILTEQNVQRSIATLTRRDLLLAPDLGSLSSGDFDKAPALVAAGRAYGQAVAASLARFSVDGPTYERWRSQRARTHQALVDGLPDTLAFVKLEGVDGPQAVRLQRQLDVRPGTAPDTELIEQDLRRLVALDDYVRLDYRLEPAPGASGEGLVYQVREDLAGMNQFRVGLDLQTDFQGQGDFRLRISHNRRDVNRLGAQWRNHLELGATVAAGTELYHPLGTDRDRFVSLYADHELRKIEWFDTDGDPFALFRRRTSRLGLDAGWHLGRVGNWGDVRFGLFGARRQSLLDYVNLDTPGGLRNQTWTEAAWRLAWVSDQLDHANFPQAGHRYQAEWQSGRYRTEQGRTPFVRWDASANQVFSHGPHTWNAYLRVGRSSAVPPGAADEYSLGGFQQLSGYRIGQVAGNALVLARLGYYQRLPVQPGVARALFVGGTLEVGNAWNSQDRERANSLRQHLRWGSSLYLGADTGIGPVYLSVVHAPRGYTGLYFLLGKP